MEEVATLLIRVQSDQAEAAKKRLNSLGFAAKEAETATGGLMKAWRGLSGLLAGGVGIAAALSGLTKLKDVATQFESLNAQLKTSTGSAANAKIAFEALQDFATQTPYDLAQTVDAFIKLTNLGLTPSERALRSYGNTASAMGKTLEDMVLAVSNATVGQFMNLRQFGVKASTEADGIVFTFQGVSTKVKNSAKEIEDYFISIGEKNFAGAMTERMVTLEGKISNLGDAWDVMFATIAKHGAGDAMKEGIDLAISAIQELTALIDSGQLGGYVDALLFKFESLSDGVVNAIEAVTAILEMSFQYWATDGKSAVDFIKDAFKNLPENVRAVAQGVGAILGFVYESMVGTVQMYMVQIENFFNYLVDTATNVGKEIWDQLSNVGRAGKFDYATAQAAAFEKFGNVAKGAWDKAVEGTDNAKAAMDEEIVAIMDERDASIAAFAAKIDGANQLRAAYDAIKKAKADAGEGKDRLAGFKVGGNPATEEFRDMVLKMRTSQQVLQETYDKRRQLIIDNTAKESDTRKQLLSQLDATYAEERKKMLDATGLDIEVRANLVADADALELEALKNSFAEKQAELDKALAAKLISEEEYARRSSQIEKRRVGAVDKLTSDQLTGMKIHQFQVYSQVLAMAGDVANTMADMVEGNSAAAKTMFVTAKGIAIAQAIISTELAAMQAAADPTNPTIFGKIAAHTAIRALGYGAVALMAAQSVAEYGGKFEHGGMIPAGKTGMTQEAGFELVRGPAVVTSARATADMMAGRGMGGANVSVNIINNAGVSIEQTEKQTDDGKMIEIVLSRAAKKVSDDIRAGSGPVSSALANAYGLRRGAA